MGATLAELVAGITGAVTREDAKKLAKLHGHPWKAVLKAMKRRDARPFLAVARSFSEPLAGAYADNAGPSLKESINHAAGMVARYGGVPGDVGRQR